MALTRILNNQITDSAEGNVYLGVNAAAKVQSYSVTAAKLANNITYDSSLTITGNLTVQGNTTSIDTVNLVVEDPLILLAAEQSGSPSLDIGFIGKRGTSDNIAWIWDESADQFAAVFTASEVTNTTVSISSYASAKFLDIEAANANITGNLTFSGTITGNVDITGNLTVGNLISDELVQGTTVTATGNLTGGNANITNAVNSATVTASGNVSGGNLTTAGNVDGANVNATSGITAGTTVIATGNVTGGNITTTGNVDGANVNATSGITAGTTIVATGNVSGGNITTAGNVDGANVNATSGITAGTTIVATGNVSGGNITTAGNVDGANVNATTAVTATTVTASGNVNGGNINSNSIVGGAIVITATSVDMDLTGNLSMSGRFINDLGTPSEATDAATKQYVDDAVSSGIHIHTPVDVESPVALPAATYNQGGTLATVTDTIAGNTVVFSSAISPQPNDQLWFANSFQGVVANIAYFVVSAPNTSAAVLSTQYNGTPVANITSAAGLTESVRLNSGFGANLTANTTGALTVDGYSVSAGNRVLVYNQNNAVENGIYVVSVAGNGSANWVLTRSDDANSYIPDSIVGLDEGSYVYVKYGDTGAGESYVMTAPQGPFNIGQAAVTFTQFSASQVYSANTQAGISLTGTVFSAKVDNDTTDFDAGGNIQVKDGANLVTPNIGDATGNSLTLTGNGLLSATTVTATGNVSGGNLTTTGDVTTATVTASGNINGANVNASSGITAGTTIAATGNVTGGNITTTGQVTATGNVDGGNVNATSAVTAGTTVTATGNVSGGNLNTAGTVVATGNVDGGNVNATSGITAGTTIVATGNVSGGNLTTTGQVLATGNITGGNLVTTGTADLGNLRIIGNDITNFASNIITVNAAGSDIDFRVSGDNETNLLVTDAGSDTVLIGTATPTTNAALKIGTTNSILIPVGNTAQRPSTGVTGMLRFNTTIDSVEFYDSDSWETVGSQFTVITADEFVGNGSQTIFTLSEESTTAATIVSINGVVQIPTTAYSVSGNVLTFTEAPEVSDIIDARLLTTTTTVTAIQNTSGNAIISASDTSAAINITGNFIPTGNGVANIGSPTATFNTIFATATSAQYADLAEMYEADAEYAPGTVLCFGGTREVTLCNQADSFRVAGVVSTNPSYLMNSGQSGEYVAAVALTGRVPCRVTGTIRKGDLIVSTGDGRGRANNAAAVGTVIGKSLADFDGADGVIEVVVGRV